MRAPLTQLHLLVFVWSFTGILGELISIGTPALVAWRTLLASVVYGLWVRFRWPERMKVDRATFLKLIGNGAILGAHWLCFFGAIAISNVSVGLAGFASTSLFTALVEPIWEKRAIRMRELALGGLVLVGLLLVAGTGDFYMSGLLLALLGAFLAAVYSVWNRKLALSGVSSTTILLYGMPGAFLMAVVLILLVPAYRFEMPVQADWGFLLVLALGCTVFAYIWYTNLLRHLTAYTSSLAINFEPVYGILLAMVLFQEHKDFHPTFYFGTLAIVGANVLHGWMNERTT